jgi:hypothetical protein
MFSEEGMIQTGLAATSMPKKNIKLSKWVTKLAGWTETFRYKTI